ncbi:MAG: hypothetical protein EXR89_01875 [Methylococcaceae bacterium]|nr:hypothetical protein [Methylococcaceae bacterium]
MQTKKEVFATLQVLKQGRAEMVQDFLDHKPDIYTPSFKYEDSPALLNLAREKYFMTWLISHWQLFRHEATFFTDKQKETEAIFATVFLKLLGKWAIIKTDHAGQLNLGIQLIQDMQNTLSEFIKVGDNSDTMRKKFEVEIEKNRVLFEREIKKLSEMKI